MGAGMGERRVALFASIVILWLFLDAADGLVGTDAPVPAPKRCDSTVQRLRGGGLPRSVKMDRKRKAEEQKKHGKGKRLRGFCKKQAGKRDKDVAEENRLAPKAFSEMLVQRLRGGGRLPRSIKVERKRQAEEQMKHGIGKSMWRREKPPLSKREQRSQNIMEQIRDKASTLSKNAQVNAAPFPPCQLSSCKHFTSLLEIERASLTIVHVAGCRLVNDG